MKNMFSEGQTDLIFTMLMAEATNTDPFEMEETLKSNGLVKKPTTI